MKPQREFDVILRGGRLSQALHAICTAAQRRKWRARIRLLEDWARVDDREERDLFVVMQHADLLNESELQQARRKRTAGEKRFLVLPDETPLESIWERIFKLGVRSAHRIHTPRLETGDIRTYLKRFLSSLAESSEQQAIMDAWWEGEQFVVISPTFERLHVPVDVIAKIRHAPIEERHNFEIDECGTFVYWPGHDVHMGWEQFHQAVDPQARVRAQQKSEAFDKRYGQAIRRLRVEKGLTQAQIAGLDARTVRRIEHGLTRVSANALRKLAAAHGMEVNHYLSQVAARSQMRPATSS